MTRTLTPYEQTHLARFGKGQISIAEYGEMPVEYITGKVEFGGSVFTITQDTLIPRIESEELIDLGLEFVEQFRTKDRVRIADVGCGCGAIGISVALAIHRAMPQMNIELVMSDISAAAVQVAQQNVRTLLPPTVSTELIVSDLLSEIKHQTFDLMIANLPYIPTDRLSILDKSVTEFEPRIALDGGDDGLGLIRSFLTQAKPYLAPHSMIILEIDYTHTVSELTVPGLDVEIRTIEDQFHRTRFALVKPL